MRSGLRSVFFDDRTRIVKILVTAVFFPPQNLIASQRPYVWARTWAGLGHDVIVLTVEKDEGASDRLSKSFQGFQVVQVPAGSLIQGLRRRRRESQVLPDRPKRAGPNDPSWKSRLVSWLKRRGLMSSVRWPDAFDLVLPNVWRDLPSGRFDVIVSSFGPHASLAMGYFAKRRSPNAKWVLDFRDLWVGNHVYPGVWPFTILESLLERFYVSRADMIATVSEALANELRTRYPKKNIVVSPNGFDPEEVAGSPKLASDFRNEHYTVTYTGSLHEDQRNPEPLFEALAKLPPDIRSKIRVKFAGPIPEFLPSLVARCDVADSVQLLGKRSREESLRLQAEADVLLFLEKQHDETRDGVLTGKLFEYLVTGRPVYGVGIGPRSTVGKLLAEARAGEVFGRDSSRLAESLMKAVENGRQPSRKTEWPEDVAHRYNRVTLAQTLLREIEKL